MPEWNSFLFKSGFVSREKGVKKKEMYGLENIMPLLWQRTRKQCLLLVQGVPPFQGLCLVCAEGIGKPQRRWIRSNLTRRRSQYFI